METSSDLKSALTVLGLRSMPRSRRDLARLVARRHPARQPWSSPHTAAYRRLWESLEPGADLPLTTAA